MTGVMFHIIRRRPRGTRRGGFTIVEVMVASIVASLVLLAVYTVFGQATLVEAALTRGQAESGAAAAVADDIVEALEQAVNVSKFKAIRMQRSKEDDTWSLIVLTQRTPTAGRQHPSAATELRRYRWGFPEKDPRAGTIELQCQPFAGSHNVTFSNDRQIEGDSAEAADALWETIEPQTVARKVADVQIRFRKFGTASWSSAWNDKAGNVVATIKVDVGQQTVERVAWPRASGDLIGQNQ